MADVERLIGMLESTANLMRGMTMDRRIPGDARSVLLHKAEEIDALVEQELP